MARSKPSDHRRSGPDSGRERPRGRSEDRPAERGGERSGHAWLYGPHAVLAALANPRRRSRRLILTPAAAETYGRQLAELDGPPPETASREEIDRLLPAGAVHQGIALAADPLSDLALEDVLAGLPEGRGLAVVLDQVTDPHNVGAILRSAAAFGADVVLQPERHAPGATGVLAKAASGALDLVPLVHVVNLARELDRLKAAGFWCVGLDSDAEQAVADADITGRIALVLGAEGAGLRRLTRERCDLVVRLPTQHRLASLNVSNAAAIALYEIARRR
ncbi:MAG: 23S rRNA (guanosine(2251)-2'-O)-methyltransferase RlmB [Alphaproteobacteria bacterium]|nr:23S rRNA (guanosine(2251)-2'-O)-methyltransferase RlmB [Alphaproteobacteria bacterium]